MKRTYRWFWSFLLGCIGIGIVCQHTDFWTAIGLGLLFWGHSIQTAINIQDESAIQRLRHLLHDH